MCFQGIFILALLPPFMNKSMIAITHEKASMKIVSYATKIHPQMCAILHCLQNKA